MLLSIKLKQLLITLVFISIFAEVIALKRKKSSKKPKENKNIDTNSHGLCQKLGNYYEQSALKDVALEFYKTKGGKNLENRVKKGNKRKKGRRSKTRTQNRDDSLDYNTFSTYHIKNINKPIQLECDLIRPRLAFVPDGKICKSIGEYFIQFGVTVYYDFFKYLLKVEKKGKRGSILKKLTSTLENLLKKYAARKGELKAVDKIIAGIDAYYLAYRSKIIPHYNAFYTFYNEKYTKDKIDGHVDTAHCDFFVRIPAAPTQDKINEAVE